MDNDGTRIATEQDNSLLEESKLHNRTKSRFLNFIGNMTPIGENSFAVSDASQLFEEFGQGHVLSS